MANDLGYIPLGRGFFAHYLWEESRIYSRAEAWLDLLQQGAYQPHQRLVGGTVFQIARGEIVAAERFLATRWQWSRTKLRTFLTALRTDKMISTRKSHTITIITLCNYERYNPEKFEKKPFEDRSKTTVVPSKNQREVREIKEENSQSTDGHLPGQITPTIDEVITKALIIGCPREEAERFFHHFAAVGWVTKNGQPIVNWDSKLAFWWAEIKTKNQRSAQDEKRIRSSSHSYQQRASDRNAGTLNGHGTSDYSRVGKLAGSRSVPDLR